MSYQESQIGNDKDKRELALLRGRAVEYYTECIEQGIRIGSIEDMDLFEKGQLETQLAECSNEETQLAKNFDERVEARANKDVIYEEFLYESTRIASTSFEDHYNKKIGLLSKYFPERFGENGRQDIRSLSKIQVGALFSRIVEYSRKRTK